MFVHTFEKGKGSRVRRAGARRLAGKVLGLYTPCAAWRGGAGTVLIWGLGVARGVYRLVVALEEESRVPEWFAGDSVGNSDLATSCTAPRRSANCLGISRTSRWCSGGTTWQASV